MTTTVRSRDELYAIFKNEVQLNAQTLTDFEEGSLNDAIAGAVATMGSEVTKTIIDEFSKTFFKSANGPDITGNSDDLEDLAVDHYGDDFSRPEEQPAVGIVQFTRANDDAGDVIIDAGTIVKTAPDNNGQEQRFATLAQVTMTATSINASVQAVVEGTKGNVVADSVIIIETTLADASIVVNNSDDFSGGDAAQDDGTYRVTIENLIKTLKGATKTALEAKLLTVSGIEKATVQEFLLTVIEWDDGLEAPVGESFRIARTKAYIADANGSANDALITNAEASLAVVKACGIEIEIEAAEALSFNWTAQIELNPSGPNFAELSEDTSMIVQSMREYLQGLAIGADFGRAVANATIFAKWGPAGSNDLAAFYTLFPTGDVVAANNQKLVPGTLATQ